jgi:phage-related protein
VLLTHNNECVILYDDGGGRLYKAITYKDRNGNDEVADYIQELNSKMATNKDARISYKKIMEYIGQLQTYGVSAGEPAIKHITNTELWELRPIDDRILFAIGKIMSLCCFLTLPRKREKPHYGKSSGQSKT